MSDKKAQLSQFYQKALNEKAQEDKLEQDLHDDQRYRSMHSIATGGMKKIVRGRDAKTGRTLAIAQLVGSPSHSEIKEFIDEARLQAALDHPGIPTVYDIDSNEKGEPFFTMKYVEGETLGTILNNLKENDQYYLEKFPLSKLIDILKETCDIVAYAHLHSVVHFDIKPENVLVGRNDKVYLCDWGISAHKNYSDEQEISDLESAHLRQFKTMTMSGWVKGTPGYMSPEQAKGNSSEKGKLCDIYALGALLYTCLYHRPPIQGENAYEIIQKTQQGQIQKAPDQSIEKAPKKLHAIAMKALSLKAANRQQNVTEFLTELQNWQAKPKQSQQHKHSKVILSSLCSLTIILIGLLLYIPKQSPKPSRQKNEATTTKNKENKSIVSQKAQSKATVENKKTTKKTVAAPPKATVITENKTPVKEQKFPLSESLRHGALMRIKYRLFQKRGSELSLAEKITLEKALEKYDSDKNGQINHSEKVALRQFLHR